jgi:acyl-coenzyme A synthetase/AMP-(fatty) acid ligase
VGKEQLKNAMHMLSEHIVSKPVHIAFWETSGKTLTFGEVGAQISHAQEVLKKNGFELGAKVVLFAKPSAEMFSWIGAILGLGGTVIVMEPWMSGAQVTQALASVSPTLFIHDWIGWLWGARLKAIRKIPRWVSMSCKHSAQPMQIEPVDELSHAVITFTTGSTGTQKGVVRTHATLNATRDILLNRTGTRNFSGPDLCIFAGFAMVNLASGRTTLLVNPWKRNTIKALNALPRPLLPVSLTSGPTFLKRVLEESSITSFQHLDVGGAPCDCNLLSKAFERWPNAHVNWVYGGTEVEPIAVVDAKFAVQKSRERGLFQVLFLGKPVPEIGCKQDGESLWVEGPHVSPLYIASAQENERLKRVDSSGHLWHCTGDRVLPDANGDLWYEGRTAQPHAHFLAEQKIYTILKHSAAFVYCNKDNEACAVGINIASMALEIKEGNPIIKHVMNVAKIHYDRRHHARIDRTATVKKELS